MREEKKMYDMVFTKMLYNKASRALIPLSGTFELSPVCNFSCRRPCSADTGQELSLF